MQTNETGNTFSELQYMYTDLTRNLANERAYAAERIKQLEERLEAEKKLRFLASDDQRRA